DSCRPQRRTEPRAYDGQRQGGTPLGELPDSDYVLRSASSHGLSDSRRGRSRRDHPVGGVSRQTVPRSGAPGGRRKRTSTEGDGLCAKRRACLVVLRVALPRWADYTPLLIRTALVGE